MRTRSTALSLALVSAVAWLIADQTPPARAERPTPRAKSEAAPRTKTPAKASRKQPKPTPAATLGHLETRARLVTVSVGSAGPVYTVRTKDGRLLHQNLTGHELRAKAPDLHRLVTEGYARNASNQGLKLDASVRVP